MANDIIIQVKADTSLLKKAETHLKSFGEKCQEVVHRNTNIFSGFILPLAAIRLAFQGLGTAINNFVIAPLAGEVGVHPGEFSLRQLFQMAEGKRRQEWYRAAVLACTISNPWRDPAHSLKMEHFPYCQEHKAKVRMATSAEIAAFAKAWNRGR